MLTFYGYKKCSTCRKAEKALEKSGRAFNFVDITENPPSAAALKKIVQQSGKPGEPGALPLELKKFFNTSGIQYKELKIKDKIPGMTESQILAMLAGNGRLLKRPLVTDGSRSTVGFDEAVFGKTWR